MPPRFMWGWRSRVMRFANAVLATILFAQVFIMGCSQHRYTSVSSAMSATPGLSSGRILIQEDRGHESIAVIDTNVGITVVVFERTRDGKYWLPGNGAGGAAPTPMDGMSVGGGVLSGIGRGLGWAYGQTLDPQIARVVVFAEGMEFEALLSGGWWLVVAETVPFRYSKVIAYDNDNNIIAEHTFEWS